MNNVSEESLNKLIEFIVDLCNKHSRFKRGLLIRISNDDGFENFPEFIKYQKKQYRVKAKSLYKNVKDDGLRNQLIKDYIEMSWYQSINRPDRFMLFCFYQMENLLNYYAESTNAHLKIKQNPVSYKTIYRGNFQVNPYSNFFRKGVETPLSKVSIWSKITYWVKDSDSLDWQKRNHFNFSNLVNIRNHESHRNTSQSNKIVLDYLNKLKMEDNTANYGFCIGILQKILSTLKSS